MLVSGRVTNSIKNHRTSKMNYFEYLKRKICEQFPVSFTPDIGYSSLLIGCNDCMSTMIDAITKCSKIASLLGTSDRYTQVIFPTNLHHALLVSSEKKTPKQKNNKWLKKNTSWWHKWKIFLYVDACTKMRPKSSQAGSVQSIISLMEFPHVFSTINMDTMLVPTRLVPMLVENSVILL